MKLDDKSLANWLLSGTVLLALLVYGRPLLVPLVFALLLWAVLNALAEMLQRLHFPSPLAWLAAFALIGAALYFVALVLANETAALAIQAPVYAEKLNRMLSAYVPVARIVPAFDIQTLLKDSNITGLLGRMAASIGTILLDLILVAIYVGFLLAEQRHLPEKLARLQRNAVTGTGGEKVIHAIGRQVQSYLGVLTLLSVAMGTVCYAVLTVMGVDFAGFWALVMFFLTYIPTVGALGVALPALMALAQFGSAGPAAVILVILSVTHFFLTNVVGTVLLGRTLNLSPFAIILSLTFWGLVWGVAGLFLAVPLTGAVAIACRHLEGLEWLAELAAGPLPRPRRWRAKQTNLQG